MSDFHHVGELRWIFIRPVFQLILVQKKGFQLLCLSQLNFSARSDISRSTVQTNCFRWKVWCWKKIEKKKSILKTGKLNFQSIHYFIFEFLFQCEAELMKGFPGKNIKWKLTKVYRKKGLKILFTFQPIQLKSFPLNQF